MPARAPNLTEKNAALVFALFEAWGDPIPHDHQQLMAAEHACSLIEYDHYPRRRADGGTNHPSNLRPRPRAEHREKTAKIDQPQISKRKRIVRANDASVNRLLARQTGDLVREPVRRRWPSRKIAAPANPWGKRRRG